MELAQVEESSGHWLSHVNIPVVLVSFGRSPPAHVPNVLLGDNF